ncbi:hypothetical protein [Pantoea sp. Tr-811]|uniref:hypothetical protein n=1 Tax=Pantoea sp. Tr-811 TaxID=2608361 RepID=UPI001963D7C7|nr:hypothetical protein [Pantoea sp. Tr-811]
MSNMFDVANNTRYATPEQADARAREILAQFPTAQVYTAQVLKEYTAKVDITVADPAEPVEEQAPE